LSADIAIWSSDEQLASASPSKFPNFSSKFPAVASKISSLSTRVWETIAVTFVVILEPTSIISLNSYIPSAKVAH